MSDKQVWTEEVLFDLARRIDKRVEFTIEFNRKQGRRIDTKFSQELYILERDVMTTVAEINSKGRSEKAQKIKHLVMAEYCLLHIKRVVVVGLPPVYKNISEFMFDFAADFPWSDPDRSECIEFVKVYAKDGLLAADLLAKFGVNIDTIG